jgi:hypothetical protein
MVVMMPKHVKIATALDPTEWCDYPLIANVFGILAPAEDLLVKRSYRDPNLRFAKLSSAHGSPRYWRRDAIVAWATQAFRNYPTFVAQVREQLLPTQKRKKK